MPDDPHPGWTNVVDPVTGDLVASFERLGGRRLVTRRQGLLTARRDSVRGAELAVWWGRGLKERIDEGTAARPMVPRSWSGPA